MVLPSEGKAQSAFVRDDGFKALVARQAEENASVMGVVLNDE